MSLRHVPPTREREFGRASIPAVVAGAMLLALSVLVARDPGAVSGGARVRVSLAGVTLDAAFWLLLAVAAAGLGAALLLSRSGRVAAGRVLRDPRQRLVAAAVAAFAALTLAPVREAGREASLYLALSSAGLALLLPPVWPRLSQRVGRVMTAVQGWALRVPAVTFVGTAALFVLVVATACSRTLFGGIPHVQDSIAQVFQAHIFATGRAWLPPPAFPVFFEYPHVITEPRWFSQFQPGHPAMLALGVLLGSPWLVNPVLGAASIVAIYWLGREAYDDALGRGGALLAAASPFLVFMSAEFMNHATALLCLTVYLAGVARLVRRGGGLGAAFATGLGAGLAAVTRSLTALAVLTPAAVYLLILVLRGRRSLLVPLLVIGLAGSVPVAGFLAFNYATTGNALTSGYEAKYGPEHNPGFGHSGWGPPHTPARGILNTLSNLNGVQKSLFEWPVPSLVFVLVLLLSGRLRTWDWLLLGTWASLTVAYFFYWYQDLCFGPRFQYEALPVFVLLTARGIASVPELVRTSGTTATQADAMRRGALLFAAIAAATGLAVNVPPRVAAYGDSYWGVSQALATRIRESHLSNAIVLVSGDYGAAFLENVSGGMPGEGPVIAARNLLGAAPALARVQPGRRLYLAEGSALTPVRSAMDLLLAQARQWDRQWTLVGDCDPDGTGLLIGVTRERAPADPPLVLRTRSERGGCGLERRMTAPEAGVVEIAVAAAVTGGNGGRVRFRAFADGRELPVGVRSVAFGEWRVFQWPLGVPLGTDVTIRVEQGTAEAMPGQASWAFARVVSGRRLAQFRPSLTFHAPHAAGEAVPASRVDQAPSSPSGER